MTTAAKIPAAPAVVFWELTRKCALSCLHCRAAGAPSKNELGAEDAMRIAAELAQKGVKTVVLTGGEPTMCKWWEAAAKRLAAGGVRVRLFTSGFDFDEETLSKALDAGVAEFAVSLDGPRRIHDELRPVARGRARSSYVAAVEALRILAAGNCETRIVTAVSRINEPCLAELYGIVKELAAPRWQVHLCQNHGRAADRSDELMCSQESLEKIVSVLLLAAKEKSVLAPMHCTIGYMTEEEPVLRGRESKGSPVWRGCRAGISSMAIAADGGVKGCTALPDDFITASLLDRTLEEIWADDLLFPYSRSWSAEVLTGHCASCAFKETCRAGCPAVAYGATGSIGFNPYCLKLLRRRVRR